MCKRRICAYLRFVFKLLNVVPNLVPRVDIDVIAAMAINEAISPYSMAVAPLEFSNRLRSESMIFSLSTQCLIKFRSNPVKGAGKTILPGP
jgi:hypothetical protein